MYLKVDINIPIANSTYNPLTLSKRSKYTKIALTALETQ
jgi:hypothetical protein